jgi:hypothetical protein
VYSLLRFAIFMGTSPKNCALLGGTRNRLKSKKTAKLKDKQTTIAMHVPTLPITKFATFPSSDI